jgi:hypothetical protein
MIHHGQRLALLGEAGEHLTGVHSEFYDFEGYLPTNGFALLGEVHRAHASFAQNSKDLIATEVVSTGCRCRCIEDWSIGVNRTIESTLD